MVTINNKLIVEECYDLNCGGTNMLTYYAYQYAQYGDGVTDFLGEFPGLNSIRLKLNTKTYLHPGQIHILI